MSFRKNVALVLLWGLSFSGSLSAQELMTPPPAVEPTVLLRPQAPPNRLDNVLQEPTPPARPLLLPGNAADGLPPPGIIKAPERLVQPWKFDLTFIPEGSGGVGMVDLEGSATFRVPFDAQLPPLLITPGMAVRFWKGPDWFFFPFSDDGRLTLYDFYVDLGWRPRVAEWLFLDLGLTPGIYTDLKKVTSESFFLRGRAIGIFALSESFQIVAGLLFVNRLSTDVIPALGFIWNASEETKVQLVFPQPKIAHRFSCNNGVQWWGYVGGDFGGGTWTVEGPFDQVSKVDYRDWRLLVGVEAVTSYDLRGKVELGYVFNRRFEFSSWWRPDIDVDSSFMLRIGVVY